MLYFSIHFLNLVNDIIELPLRRVPFALLHVWKHNAKLDESKYDFLGISVGKIPLVERSPASEDTIDISGVTYKWINSIGKVSSLFVYILRNPNLSESLIYTTKGKFQNQF